MDVEPALFDASREGPRTPRRPAPDAAEDRPYARVWIEAQVPHLDRAFDYLVPESLSADACEGAKVRLVFGGQQINGWIVSRSDEPETDRTLRPLKRVLSPHPVLSPERLELFSRIAARQMSTVADVIRVAVPPRVAAVDSSFVAAEARADGRSAQEVRAAAAEALGAWAPAEGRQRLAESEGGRAFLDSLAQGASPRAVAVLPRAGVGALVEPLRACLASGRRAVVVVPDQRRLEELEAELAELLGPALGRESVGESREAVVVRLNAEDPPTRRYRSYLRALSGHAEAVIGTRSAAFGPLADVGLVAVWDDGDDSLAERRSPYIHARDVLVARAVESGAAFLSLAQSPSAESLRLAAIGWARLVEDRPDPSRRPRVTATGSEFETGRDRLAQAARIPSRAFAAARKGLERGPVLVHVARTGYSPVVKCRRCGERALCPTCQGPVLIAVEDGRKRARCAWCARAPEELACRECGCREFYQPVAGALRTADELGRAFPGVPVVASSGDSIRESVGEEPALVVATPGAEPRVLTEDGRESGYAAALVLDAESTLAQNSMHALERALRRWFRVMALVRAEGEVVATVAESAALNALVGYDPVPAVRRDLDQRRELGLPPSVRAVSLTGGSEAVSRFWEKVRADLDRGGPLDREPRVIGPTPVEDPEAEEPVFRLLVLFGYRDAARLSEAVRARRVLDAASASAPKVAVRCDPPEVL
ncbi:primosomal protein N' [Arthrobacter sp. UM1]|uniref:primosomal protein N' family DNA-binding protein n=1 Tax=Arthrobacter sp. UM1 TaxID=2766776 RepID=UPI001CF70836|nr:primosomal protein N' [Arthrobacter sp. UM1]MCB4207563.1 primosomal protein N' [Arthrobacter sp. UM1]